MTPTQQELAAYTASRLEYDPSALAASLPLAAERHIATWERYVEEARQVGVFAALSRVLVQLRFPIEAGISTREDYRAATRRGVFPEGGPGLDLVAPERLRLELYPGAAGPIPVLTAGDRRDFITLVQALIKRNEPVPVPDSMGAAMIAGLNNWDRVNAHREAWENTPPAERVHATWAEAFQAMAQDKPAFQDRLILLSEGPYSNVPASRLGLDDAAWTALSHTLRLEHEYTHYFTLRTIGSMRNNLLDELVADALGLLAATGRFDAAWFLHFMGLEDFPAYREGGRAQNYRGEPPLTDEAFAGLLALVEAAARNLEARTRDQDDWADPMARARLVLALSGQTLDELAAAATVGSGDSR